jgi:hypothetical protein
MVPVQGKSSKFEVNSCLVRAKFLVLGQHLFAVSLIVEGGEGSPLVSFIPFFFLRYDLML